MHEMSNEVNGQQEEGMDWLAMSEDEKEEFKEEKEKNKRLPISELYRIVARAIEGEYLPSIWKKFPTTYKIIRDSSGSHENVQIDPDGVVHVVKDDSILCDIASYITNAKANVSFPRDKDCKEILNYWKRITRPLDPTTIAMVLQKSKPGITWRRLPFDLSEGPTPLFDDMMNRTTNSRYLMDFIGSLFFPESDRQTYVWIYGEGGDGKGSLVSVLANILGDAYSSEITKVNQFWTYGLLGKRLVTFPDCEDFLFPTSGLFKQITGGDKVRMERKNKNSFTSDLICKCLFLSNTKPELSTVEADMRRVIYCEMTRASEIVSPETYRQRLWDESKHFIWKCIRQYMTHYPTHQPIRANRAEIEQVAGEKDEFLRMIFDRHFILVPPKNRNEGVPDPDKPSVAANVVQGVLQHEKLTFVERRAFTRMIRDKFKCVGKVVEDPPKTFTRKWLWIKEKEGSQIAFDAARRM